MMEECIFCKIITGDIPAKKVYEDEKIIAFEDINPQAPTHTLIIPREHIPTLNDLSQENKELIGRMFLVASELAAKAGVSEEGYRLVMNCNRAAGQEVFHIHLHLLGGRIFTWPPG